MVQEWP